jgi:hypothetical protein
MQRDEVARVEMASVCVCCQVCCVCKPQDLIENTWQAWQHILLSNIRAAPSTPATRVSASPRRSTLAASAAQGGGVSAGPRVVASGSSHGSPWHMPSPRGSSHGTHSPHVPPVASRPLSRPHTPKITAEQLKLRWEREGGAGAGSDVKEHVFSPPPRQDLESIFGRAQQRGASPAARCHEPSIARLPLAAESPRTLTMRGS